MLRHEHSSAMTHDDQVYVNMTSPVWPVQNPCPMNIWPMHWHQPQWHSMNLPYFTYPQPQAQMLAPYFGGMVNAHQPLPIDYSMPCPQPLMQATYSPPSTSGYEQHFEMQFLEHVGSTSLGRASPPASANGRAVVLAQKVLTSTEQNTSIDASTPEDPYMWGERTLCEALGAHTSPAQVARSLTPVLAQEVSNEAPLPMSLPSLVQPIETAPGGFCHEAPALDKEPSPCLVSLPESEASSHIEGARRLVTLTSTAVDDPDALQMLALCCTARAQPTPHQTESRRAKSKAVKNVPLACTTCGTKETPKWRVGSTLCNACGLKTPEAKENQKRRRTLEYVQASQEEAEARNARYEVAASHMAKLAVSDQERPEGSSGAGITHPRKCLSCHTTNTSKWRVGNALCNACGLGGKRRLKTKHGR